MAPSVVRVVKAFSRGLFASSWVINAVATRTAKSPSTTVTAVSTAVCKNAWLWACVVTVSKYKFSTLYSRNLEYVVVLVNVGPR